MEEINIEELELVSGGGKFWSWVGIYDAVTDFWKGFVQGVEEGYKNG